MTTRAPSPATAAAEIAAQRAEIDRLRAELTEARRQVLASERLAELGTLTGGLAHEIKNPLSTVQLNLQLLGEDIDPGWPGSQRVISRLKTVQRETTRLREILDGFLKYAGKLELEPVDLDLQRLLDELTDFFEPQANLARVRIFLRPPPPGGVHVRADERLIKQTVLNLMLNAVQAIAAKGEDAQGELILSATRTGDWGELHVIDTGVGIPPDMQARIFDAYYTTRKGGTGLGLAMARRIIREHGGELSVSSEIGKGSEFVLRLPVV